MNKYQEDINYLIAMDSLEKEIQKVLSTTDLSQKEIVDKINELERDIKDLQRNRELNRRKG